MDKKLSGFNDYGMWKLLAWSGPIFLALFFFLWGVLAKNFPPVSPDWDAARIYQHYLENGMAIKIGMSICIVAGAFYMSFGTAVSALIRRVDGEASLLANLEMCGATITCCPIIVACGMWLAAALEAPILTPEIVHLLHHMGWMIIDLAYMVTTMQIFAASTAFLRDKRPQKLVPAWVSWWGYVTCISFFPVSLIPFFKTGPFAWNGLFNFWVAFPTWYIWLLTLSFYVIKGVERIRQEDMGIVPAPAKGATVAGVATAR